MDIQIKNLSVSFPSPQGDAKVLRDADIILKSGKITAIVGESGSGKSILGAAVMGLLEQPVRVSGEILFGDTDLLSLSEKELNSVRGSRVGWIAQDPVAAMDPMVKVGGQMMEGVHFYQDGNDTKADGIRQLEEFGLADAQRVWDTYPFHLSGGMAQRVLTAMMTLPGPEWLIADEPTKGLDAFVRRQAAGAFRKLREKGVGILLITHDLRLAERLSDFLAVMYAGEIIEYGKTKDTFSNPVHPYTKGLFAAAPDRGMQPIRGIAPDLSRLPGGCVFASRCPAYEKIPAMKSRKCLRLQKVIASAVSGKEAAYDPSFCGTYFLRGRNGIYPQTEKRNPS